MIALDERVRRLGRRGELLLGGEPFRLLRLSAEGARVLDRLLDQGEDSSSAQALAARLTGAGVAHPVVSGPAGDLGNVTVVVPVRNDARRLERLLAAMRQGDAVEVIVVDDGSRDSRCVETACRTFGARFQAAVVGGAEFASIGPAGARNAAREHAEQASSVVVFVDSDVVPEAGWLGVLLEHFSDPTVGAVAPRVRARLGEGVEVRGSLCRSVASYELRRSPLDLGASPSIVGAHRRVSYVPSAALACRIEALADVGWFDETLRVGEDVDLVRRLESAGWTVRYEPAALVWHDSREGVVSFARQRYRYGLSAASIDARHAGTVAPFESGVWGLAGLVPVVALVAGLGAWRRRSSQRKSRSSANLLALGGLVSWTVATGVPVRSLGEKLRNAGCLGAFGPATSAVMRGQAGTALGALAAVRRTWWPAIFLCAVGVPRWRAFAASSLFVAECAGLGDLARSSERGDLARSSERRDLARSSERVLRRLPLFALLGVVDDASYGTGVLVGCVRERRLGPLLPRLRGTGRMRSDGEA